MGKAEAGEDRGGARRRGMGADVGEPRLDLGDAVRVGRGLRLGKQRGCARGRPASTISIRLSGPSGASCGSRPMVARDGQAKRPVLDREIADDGAEQGALAGAVAADETDAGAGRNLRRRPLDQEPAGHAQGYIVDHQHGRGMAALAAAMQPVRRRLRPSAGHGLPEPGRWRHNPGNRRVRPGRGDKGDGNVRSRM